VMDNGTRHPAVTCHRKVRPWTCIRPQVCVRRTHGAAVRTATVRLVRRIRSSPSEKKRDGVEREKGGVHARER